MSRYHISGPVGDSTECSASTTNAYIDASSGTSASMGSQAYIDNGNALGTNAYTGCGRNTEKCCLKTVPSSLFSPYVMRIHTLYCCCYNPYLVVYWEP